MAEGVTPGGAHARRRRFAAGVVAAAAAAMLVSGCGSSSSSSSASSGSGSSASSSSSSGSAPKPKGSPIVTYTITDVNTQGPSYKNIQETERVYAAWVNAHGGIAGHPLDARFCDGQGTPTQATTCARQAVAAHAVAVIGSFTFTGDAIVPSLQAGHIAYFGNCCATAPSEFTSPVSFPMGDQPLYAVGLVQRAHADGCKKPSAVIIHGAETFEPLMSNAAKALGMPAFKYVTLPATAQDYSPQVAQATSGGADCVVMVVSETPFIAWMPAFVQSGSTARLYGPQGNLDEKVIKGVPTSATNGDVIAAMYPSITLPAWADYRAALKQYNADSKQDYDSLGGEGTWAAYSAFAQIVKKMKGPINNTTFLAAANKAKVNLPGMVPPLDFTKPWIKEGGPKGYDRLFNLTVVFNKIDNGKIVPLTTNFENVGNLAVGKAQ